MGGDYKTGIEENALKGQVKFQITPIELKLGENDPGYKATMQNVSSRMSPKVIWGQRSGQNSNCSDSELISGESFPGHMAHHYFQV